MKALLVVMPWASLHRPSLGAGILTQIGRDIDGCRMSQCYANLEWARFLLAETGGAITPDDYNDVAERYLAGAGEWVFAGALHQTPGWREQEFLAHLGDGSGLDGELLVTMARLAPAFVEHLCERLTAEAYDVIGFSTTFMQNVPSLALARALKKARPETTIIFGGANCDGSQGAAIHNNFPFVDIVARGESDHIFRQLVEAVRAADENMLRRIPGLCWRTGDGRSVTNPSTAAPLLMKSVRHPWYDEYFETLGTTGIGAWVEPELVLESSRGCWWGEKHHCTFCGLNGSAMKFRSKTQGDFVDELDAAVRRHRVLDISLADNILDMKYFNEFLPRLAELDWDLRIHCEVKANLTVEQVRTLRDAGVVNIQPGIESLSSDTLRLMDKGVTGVQNVRLLRDCQQEGLTVEWNWLCGFPKEDESQYDALIGQFPALVHLQPPLGVSRVALERFSPYFERPELGFVNAGPARVFEIVYDLPRAELEQLVYLFDSPLHGVSEETVERVGAAVDTWRAGHDTGNSTLVVTRSGDHLVIRDRRAGWPVQDHVLAPGGRAEAYQALDRGRTPQSLEAYLRETHGLACGPRLATWLDEFVAAGLVFTEAGRYVALATAERPGVAPARPQPANAGAGTR
ncbi:RiPP maturation radical SAM C-methyltransferase [Nonomuraea spiralis]|uniref:RiPP maturation radical SAM C-methyltransferase n=1 Tax=Nonomuraea spiralis TaxID=46182 RepID=UPI0037A7213E